LPTEFRVLAGTPVILVTTLAGWVVPVTEPPEPLPPGLLPSLMKTKVSTMASTTTTLPPAIRTCLRTSAPRAAARCAAIFSLAFCCLILVALLMPACLTRPDSSGRQRHTPRFGSLSQG
jgi:hypothetical protein